MDCQVSGVFQLYVCTSMWYNWRYNSTQVSGVFQLAIWRKWLLWTLPNSSPLYPLYVCMHCIYSTVFTVCTPLVFHWKEMYWLDCIILKSNVLHRLHWLFHRIARYCINDWTALHWFCAQIALIALIALTIHWMSPYWNDFLHWVPRTKMQATPLTEPPDLT